MQMNGLLAGASAGSPASSYRHLVGPSSLLRPTLLVAVAHKTTPGIQWTTLAWIAGAAVAATVAIAVIVLVSRRPKSMEDGIAEFSRSLQAVAPVHRLPSRHTAERSSAEQKPPAPRPPSPRPPAANESGTVRMRRGETETV
ncbi:MAG TPA: hypothetical protein VFN61_15390 [Acidimicrobiales bacterium]|nr:hypothetical protein [Acidimicrobiales bacterium]